MALPVRRTVLQRLLLASVLAVAATAVLPGAALGTVNVSGGPGPDAWFVAAQSSDVFSVDQNAQAVDDDSFAGEVTITSQTGVAVGAGTTHCRQTEANVVKCNYPTVNRVSVSDSTGPDAITLTETNGTSRLAWELVLGSGNDSVDAADLTRAVQVSEIGSQPSNDVAIGGSGADSISLGSGDDVMRGNAGNDSLTGGAGLDRVDYTTSAAGINITASGGSDGLGGTDSFYHSFAPVEAVTASPHNDVISGMRVIAGLAGNDTMTGTTADDFFAGYDGTDTYDGSTGGTDRVSHTSNTATQGIVVVLEDGMADDTDGRGAIAENYAGIDYLFGGAGSDTIDASYLSRGVSLWGRGEDDVLYGSNSDDVLRGEQGTINNLVCNGGTDMWTNTSGTDQTPLSDCEQETAYSRNGTVTPIQ